MSKKGWPQELNEGSLDEAVERMNARLREKYWQVPDKHKFNEHRDKWMLDVLNRAFGGCARMGGAKKGGLERGRKKMEGDE